MSRSGRYGRLPAEGSKNGIKITDEHTGLDVDITPVWTKDRLDFSHLFVQRLQNVHSRNVIDVIDIIKDGDTIYLVTEHLPGPDLITLPAAFDSTTVLRRCFQVVNAVADIHAHGIAHANVCKEVFVADAEGLINLRGFSKNSRLDDSKLIIQDAERLRTIIKNHFGMYWNNIKDTELASDARQVLADELNRDNNRAQLAIGDQSWVLDKLNRNFHIKHPSGFAELEISYKSTHFCASVVKGEVYVNNAPLESGRRMPGACVISLGSPERSNALRYFIAWESSQPEIVL